MVSILCFFSKNICFFDMWLFPFFASFLSKHFYIQLHTLIFLRNLQDIIGLSFGFSVFVADMSI